MTKNLSDMLEQFHSMACKMTGLSDFGDDNYRQPLQILLKEIDQQGLLTEMGEQGLIRTIVGLLAGRLMTAEGIKKNPQAVNTEISRPLIITGMPRTGTTVLHRLMSLDPNLQSLPLWLASMPMPRPPRETWNTNPVFQQIEQGLQQFDKEAPQFRKIHPIFADKADECRWAFDQTFYSQTLANGYSLENYGSWIKTEDSSSAYRYYKQVLQLVANGDERRWLLKDPTHLNTIDGLLAVFPDTCFVLTHRQVTEVISSAANLVWSYKADRQIGLTKEEVGRFTLDTFSDCARKVESVRSTLPADRFFDVHISETRLNPIGTMERIYQHFDIPLTEACRAAWKKEIATNPDQGHPAHQHDLRAFGLSEAGVTDCFDKRYLQRLEALE